MIIETVEWKCEKCGFVNGLQIDDEYGPVLSDICGGCDAVFDLDYLRATQTP
ncbi:MAG: hypothetical protein ABFD82_03795 [Syntrophaceae bacterium]